MFLLLGAPWLLTYSLLLSGENPRWCGIFLAGHRLRSSNSYTIRVGEASGFHLDLGCVGSKIIYIAIKFTEVGNGASWQVGGVSVRQVFGEGFGYERWKTLATHTRR